MQFCKDITIGQGFNEKHSFDTSYTVHAVLVDGNPVDTSVSIGFSSLRACIDDLKQTTPEMLVNTEYVVRWNLKIFNEDTDDYETLSLDLFNVKVVDGEIKLDIAQDVLLMMEAQLSAIL